MGQDHEKQSVRTVSEVTTEYYLPPQGVASSSPIEIVGGILPTSIRIEVSEGTVTVDIFDSNDRRAKPVSGPDCASVADHGQGVFCFTAIRAVAKASTANFGARFKVTVVSRC